MATTRRIPGQRKVIIAATTSLALVALSLLGPQVAGTEAAGILGTLRVPGEPGFVAGHRGDKAGAPENTLPAMRLALASAAEFVETDLQLTADGVPVLMHDWTLDRTTDGTGPVWASTWDEISRLDAGSWYSPRFRGTPVPRLDEFLDLVWPSTKRVILELKGSWTSDQLRPVVSAIQARRLDARVLIASFDIVTLGNLGELAPALARAVIAREVIGDPAILAGTCGAIAIVTSRRFVERDPAVVDRIHAAGLGVMLYTVNDEDGWSEAIALGVDGIITDNPTKLDRWLASGAGGLAIGGRTAHDG